MNMASATAGSSIVTIRPTRTRLPVRGAAADAPALGSVAGSPGGGDVVAVNGAQPPATVASKETTNLVRVVVMAGLVWSADLAVTD
jgi:hypothetical protein